MLLGLVADTHDNVLEARHVADFFRERRVDTAFHLGDVTMPETLEPFEGMPLTVIRGNNDEDRWPESWQQEFAGIRVGATHGHMRGILARLREECEIVLHGHTHRRMVEQVGTKMVINPGALHRAPTHTCALLELPARRVVFYAVDADGVRRL